ncbi:MAG: lactonase family protein [Chloroflexi bacterium]|nr:MAG: lactonase family protein [Chloroflexota bacterium]
MNNHRTAPFTFFIGTYTQPLPHVAGRGEGVYTCRFNPSTGELSQPELASDEVVSPSYLAVSPNRRYLYAVQETDEDRTAAVYAFAVSPDSHSLRYLNHQPAHGRLPCFVSVHPAGRFVLTANYGTGSVAVHPVGDDGALHPASDVVQHTGRGPNPARQEGPHTHQVVFGPQDNLVFVPDLGLDRIMTYRLDTGQGKLHSFSPPFYSAHPGAGPRHLAFHPTGRYAFGLNELDASVIVYAHHRGTLTPRQTVSALPPDFAGEPSGSAVRVSPEGRFVYAADRGNSSIAVYAFAESTATLTLLEHQSTQGQTPRDFVIDPTGKFLLAANQDSDTIIAFHRHPSTGRLTPTGFAIHVPNPVCMVFAEQQ